MGYYMIWPGRVSDRFRARHLVTNSVTQGRFMWANRPYTWQRNDSVCRSGRLDHHVAGRAAVGVECSSIARLNNGLREVRFSP